MKIISRGTPEKELIWRGTCRGCKSVVEAKQGELTHIKDDQRDGRFSWETCPVCGAGSASGYGGVVFYPHDARGR